MAEYIEREALLAWFGDYKANDPHEYLSPQHIIDDIAEVPSADVVPVVRCKDCKHYGPQKKSAHWNCTTLYCNRVVTMKVSPDDFCSYGEQYAHGTEGRVQGKGR